MPRRDTWGIGIGVAIAAMTLGTPARALTPPLPGAVASPVPVPAPFPAGSVIRLLSGYSRAGGSSLHADTNDCCKANDYYALDIVYDTEPNSGLGLPIVAPFAGEVVRAGWSTAGWANYGQRVILRHDLGDGHVYHTLYAHMNAIDPAVVEGGVVAAGQVLGELGQSCQGALSCGSFSTPHLHWVMHRDSMVGGSGTGGSYGGNAVVPEPMSGYEDLVQGMILEVGDPVCGDAVCTGGEDSSSCPEDCPTCAPIGPAGRTIEEDDLCFVRSGSPQYWYDADVGSGGALLWTHAVDAAEADDSGRWSLVLEQPGEAQVDVWIEAGFAGSQQARYAIRHGGVTEEIVIDQSAGGGWVSLGAFDFAADGDEWVRLDDNTGEPFDAQRVLVFDAVRVMPMGGGGGGGDTGGGGMTGGDDSGGDTGAPMGDDGTGGDGNGIGDSGGAGLPGLDTSGPGAGGCACSTTPDGPRGGGWLALGLLGLRRRRR